MVAYHIASHDTQVLPKNYYHRHAPQEIEITKFNLIIFIPFYNLYFIPFILSSSKPIPTLWGFSQLILCPSWWSLSNRRLAPRYHTLALQCRYTKKPGKPDQTAPPARPPSPPKLPALPANSLLGQTSSRPSTHRRPSSTVAVSLSLSIRPMAQSRSMESRVGRNKQRESHLYPSCVGV